MAHSAYQRLTRERTAWRWAIAVPRVSLWLGSDHLLFVEQYGYRETYKRFYFRDIQAITVMETTRRTVWNAVLGIPLTICAIGVVISALPARNIPALVIWAIPALLIAVLLVINNVRGRACICELRTAVQTENLASLSRLKQTRKVLERVRPLIIAAQGQFTAEEVSVRMQAAASGIAAAPKPEPPPPTAPPIVS
jgi:hypothetical protein